jgi:hypothetical protein
MIRELAGATHRLDDVFLGVGLVVEIIKELREFGEVAASGERGRGGRRWRCCCSWRR